MSSYLSFYIVPRRKYKKEPKKYIILIAYSRGTEIYQYFNENLSIAYAGNETKYTTLSAEDVATVIKNFKEDIDKSYNRLIEYEKYASTNPNYIQEIVDLKDYIDELSYWKDKTSFIADMINEIKVNYSSGIEEVCCNID